CFRRVSAILFEVSVPREIRPLRGEGEPAAALENNVLDSQQNVLFEGEEGVLVLAAEVGEDLHVFRVGAEANETDTRGLGGDKRMAEQERAQLGEDPAHLLGRRLIAELQNGCSAVSGLASRSCPASSGRTRHWGR